MRGQLLDRVLRVGRSNTGTGGYLQVSGIEWSGDEPRFGGAALTPDRKYRVVISDFLLTGREANLPFLTRTNPDLEVLRELRDIRMALIDELKRGG
jgi:5'-nucleotidase